MLAFAYDGSHKARVWRMPLIREPQLMACGWIVQTKDRINLSADRGGEVVRTGRKQLETSGSFATIYPEKSIHWRTPMNPHFILSPFAFSLALARLRQSILQRAFEGKLVAAVT